MGKTGRPAPHGDMREAAALQLADEASFGLARRMPELSAHIVVSPSQAAILIAVAALGAGVSFLAPHIAWHAAIALTTVAFVAGTLFRLLLAAVSGRKAESGAPGTEALPTYTVLVPLYREANVVPGLAGALLAIDYPLEALDVKLIVEEDDAETVAAVERVRAHGPFDVVKVPNIGPRTKPNSCDPFLSEFREAA